ncbi:TonB family protein [Hyphococcus lacteus]|uniref:TonB family protein n=1 Tax=Hyphococcus lacteus TaxID=3143536 RepID=A0ABV3Z2B8_9PROT
MAQDKAADVINFKAPREAAANDGETVGVFLAASRIAAGISIEALSEAIKVKVAHLQSIEAMRPDLLPPLPYVIGFVKSYARHLGLDADEIAMRFRDEAGGAVPVSLSDARTQRTPDVDDDGARWVSIFAVLAITLFVAWVFFQILFNGGRDERGAAVPEKRVTLGAPIAQPVTPRSSKVNVPTPKIQAENEVLNTEPPETEVNEALEVNNAIDVAEIPEETAAVVVEPVAETPPVETPPVMEQAPVEQETVQQIVSRERAPLPRTEPSQIISSPTTSTGAQNVAQRNGSVPISERVKRPMLRRPTPAAPKPVIAPAQLIRSSAPFYPNRCASRAVALETVTVNFDVNAEGRAVNAKISSSTNDCFDSEALRTLSRWRFDPKTVDGNPAVETGKTATLNFRR